MIKQFSSYQTAQAVAPVAAGEPLIQILPPQAFFQGRVSYGLTRLRFELTTPVASQLGLVVPDTVGTPLAFSSGVLVSSPVASGGDVSLAVPGLGDLVTTWAVAPTFGAPPAYLEEGQSGALVGSIIEWRWPEEDPFTPVSLLLQGPLPKGVVVRNIAAAFSAAFLVTARWKIF
jgi:hypothetical protein